jgi:hypothetical protein
MAAEAQQIEEGSSPGTVEVPAPTAWPLVLAFGVALVFAGLATSAAVSLVGGVAALMGAIGWFRAVLPLEAHETVPKEPEAAPVVTPSREVVRYQVARGSRRAWLPVEIYPIKAGVRGGLAGGVAMAIIACLYGIVSGHGIWYPINLLSAGFFPAAVMGSAAQISRFQASAFAIACVIHLLGSVLVGMLYGALLPILPRRPILVAGFAAPILWTALEHSMIGVLNPVLNQRVDWFWFVVSQFGFGIVAGIVVSRQERIPTWQGAPFAIRAGIEASGLESHPGEEEKR